MYLSSLRGSVTQLRIGLELHSSFRGQFYITVCKSAIHSLNSEIVSFHVKIFISGFFLFLRLCSSDIIVHIDLNYTRNVISLIITVTQQIKETGNQKNKLLLHCALLTFKMSIINCLASRMILPRWFLAPTTTSCPYNPPVLLNC